LFRRRPSFSCDGNGGGGGGCQEGPIQIRDPDPGAEAGFTIAVVSSPPPPCRLLRFVNSLLAGAMGA
jgi:hypothetical protein